MLEMLPQQMKLPLKRVQFCVGEFLKFDQPGARPADGPNEFVELEMDCTRITILSVLDEEDDQEGDDSGSCVDDELPSVGKVEERPTERPCKNKENGRQEGRW